jgi:hypothetical protein
MSGPILAILPRHWDKNLHPGLPAWCHRKFPLNSADVKGFDEEGNALYRKIFKHPSLAGTYLAACTFFASFYNQSPEGFAYTAGLPAEDGKHLQQIAWETVQSFKKM